MAIQTQQLSDALPNFASLFRQADAKGSIEWQIVRWHDAEPAEATPEMAAPVDILEEFGRERPNVFGSRTEALRFSRTAIKLVRPLATQRGHWGVWRWVENGSTRYQTAIPVSRAAAEALPAMVREARTATYSPMVRVSEETNRRLREMAAEDGTTLQSVLDAAVKERYRRWFFGRADAAYQSLREDKRAWSQEMNERAAWDATLLDGVDCDESWQDDGSVRRAARKERPRG
jgi:hypothetical protein